MSVIVAANATEETRLPDLCYEATNGKVKRVISKVKVNESSKYTPQGKTGFTFNIARQLIEPRHEYRVFLIQNKKTSLVNLICIEYNANTTFEKFKAVDTTTVGNALNEDYQEN